MVVNRILYQASQSDFRQDVLVHQFVPKMLDAADKLGVHPGEPEIRSWQANSLQIKDLLELAGVQGTYVTMEYKVPYSQKRIDCMLYGRGCDNHNHVVHIEMKQWENKGVRPAESNGNFDVEQDIDDDYLVDAFTGGRNQRCRPPIPASAGIQPVSRELRRNLHEPRRRHPFAGNRLLLQLP